jgi:hypothetical protein
MKTLKVEAVYPMAFETDEDVAEHLPTSLRRSTTNAGFIRRWDISARSSSRINASARLAKQQPDQCPPSGAHSKRWVFK